MVDDQRLDQAPAWRDVLRTHLTRLFFRRLARIYGFITMPPMPPIDAELMERAASIRRLMERLREDPHAILCLAPEGRDFPAGILGQPPPGTGRLVLEACRSLQRILPVGVFENEGRLIVRFGPPFKLEDQLPARPDDQAVSTLIMRAIAALLPVHLRGDYASLTGDTL